MNLLDTAIAQLGALGTQVQTLQSQLAGYDIAGAQRTADMLQGNISASQQHLRTVAAQDSVTHPGGPDVPPFPPLETIPPPPQQGPDESGPPEVPEPEPPDESGNTEPDGEPGADTAAFDEPSHSSERRQKHHK